jgi:hypothetical protein
MLTEILRLLEYLWREVRTPEKAREWRREAGSFLFQNILSVTSLTCSYRLKIH